MSDWPHHEAQPEETPEPKVLISETDAQYIITKQRERIQRLESCMKELMRMACGQSERLCEEIAYVSGLENPFKPSQAKEEAPREA